MKLKINLITVVLGLLLTFGIWSWATSPMGLQKYQNNNYCEQRQIQLMTGNDDSVTNGVVVKQASGTTNTVVGNVTVVNTSGNAVPIQGTATVSGAMYSSVTVTGLSTNTTVCSAVTNAVYDNVLQNHAASAQLYKLGTGCATNSFDGILPACAVAEDGSSPEKHIPYYNGAISTIGTGGGAVSYTFQRFNQ